MSDPDQLTGLLDAGVSTFMNSEQIEPTETELGARNLDIGFVGVPFDSTCLSRTGANQAPNEIRKVSCQTHPYNFEYDVRISDIYSLVDFGDVQTLPGNAEKTVHRAQTVVSRLINDGIAPVVAGGDHSISIANLKAVGEIYDNPGFIMLDTHLDTAAEIDGERYNQACVVSRAIDEAGFDPSRICLVGISGTGNPEFEREYAKRHGINVFPLDEVIRRGPIKVAREAAEIAYEGTDAVHISVDIDVLDSAYAPGTGVPSPAGMESRELLQIIGEVASHSFTSMDIVEVSPPWDQSEQTSVMACRIVSDALAARASGEANGVGSKTQSLRCGSRRS
jgi:agmatinase